MGRLRQTGRKICAQNQHDDQRSHCKPDVNENDFAEDLLPLAVPGLQQLPENQV
jgi:hypothetical protein